MNSVKLFRWIFRSENGSPKLLSEFKNDNLNTNVDSSAPLSVWRYQRGNQNP